MGLVMDDDGVYAGARFPLDIFLFLLVLSVFDVSIHNHPFSYRGSDKLSRTFISYDDRFSLPHADLLCSFPVAFKPLGLEGFWNG